MGKQKISAKELLKDIKSGMGDTDLMEKYGLSSKGLESAFKKLLEVGVLDASLLKGRSTQSGPIPAQAEARREPAPAPERKASALPKLPEPLAAIAADIKGGLHDAEIMRRHDLSPGKLAQARKDLIESGHLAAEDVRQQEPKGTKPCPFCRQEIPQNAPRCAHCGQWLDMRAARAAADPGTQPHDMLPPERGRDEDKDCPWEERENYGTMSAYIQTVTRSLLTPTRFFSRLPPRDGYFNPILFGAMSAVVSVVLAFLWSKLFFGGGLGFFALIFGMAFVFVGSLIFIPIAFFVWSGMLHGFLYLLKGADEGFQATFRVVGYASVTNLFHAIPFVGQLASLWGLVLTAIGLREIHKTTTGKAVGAVLISGGIILLLAFVGVLKAGSVWSAAAKRQAMKQSQFVGPLPAEVCAAVEEFVGQVDGAQGLDDQAAQAQINEAFRNLNGALKSLPDQANLNPVRGKALAYGLSSLAQRAAAKAPAGGQERVRAAADPGKLRRELLGMCGK
ncbi:MAG: YIP1 family protein [Desulfomonile tiedjei]|nr:YIP1 family protein [Desulfomonile tiedjei]